MRFAPVAWQDRVYFVSDDGHLYCVDAADGSLRWKFRGLPTDRRDRKLLGNRRLISLAPARGGPVLADGVIYFAAGIWPSTGVFLHALDAETGQVVWSNTKSHYLENANMDHGVSRPAGLTPQGYLAMFGEVLVVPCGAQLPAFVDRKSGDLTTYTMGWGGRVGLPKGTWFVAGVDKYLAAGGDLYDVRRRNDERFPDAKGRTDFKHMLYPGGFTRILIDPTNQKDIGEFRRPVLTSKAIYYRDDGIVANDLTRPNLVKRSKKAVPEHRKDDRYPDRRQESEGLVASRNSRHAPEYACRRREAFRGDARRSALRLWR